MNHFTILGKSNYTLAIINDILSLMHGRDYQLRIVANIPDSENDSLSSEWNHNAIPTEFLSAEDWEPSDQDRCIIGTMGKARKQVTEFFLSKSAVKLGQMITLVHPSAILPESSVIGSGVLIGPSVVIAPFTSIGDFVHLNRGVTIGHHTNLSSFVKINAGTHVSGLCRLEQNATIGPGCVILDKIVIGENSVIGAMSLVNKDVPQNTVAYGNPAKVIRQID